MLQVLLMRRVTGLSQACEVQFRAGGSPYPMYFGSSPSSIIPKLSCPDKDLKGSPFGARHRPEL